MRKDIVRQVGASVTITITTIIITEPDSKP